MVISQYKHNLFCFRTENLNGGGKKVEQKQNSEDLFGSQCDKSMSKTKGTGKKSLSLSRRGSVEVSLNNEPEQPVQVINPDPSLDMFAPSCSRTVQTSDPREVRPSCEDMFGSGSRKSDEGKTSVQASTSKKLQIISEEEDDGFLSSSKKRGREPLQIVDDDQDEFAFNPSKKTKVREEINGKKEELFVTKKKAPEKNLRKDDDNDDFFSFGPSKKTKLEKENNDDVFSFKSNKSSKRNRQSDPDMFASSEASSSSSANPHKIQKMEEDDEFGFGEHRKRGNEDDCFAFPVATAPKRKESKEDSRSSVNREENVVIGILSEQNKRTETVTNGYKELGSNGFDSKSVKEDTDKPNSTVYGKFNPIHIKKVSSF